MENPINFVPTNVGKSMLAMLQDVHDRRSIGIFAGPPGIGKTTSIDAFAEANPGNVLIVKTSKPSKNGIGARMVTQETVDAMRHMLNLGSGYVPTDVYAVKNVLINLIDIWSQGQINVDYKLTLIYDEAQTFSREAIEALRYWNDRDRCFAKFPVGLVFVGNQEFALSAGKNQESVISAAVADRARYTETFRYEDVENDDLRLMLVAHGITDEMVIAYVVKRYSSGRLNRSIRRLVEQDIPDMLTVAGARSVTLDIVREALAA